MTKCLPDEAKSTKRKASKSLRGSQSRGARLHYLIPRPAPFEPPPHLRRRRMRHQKHWMDGLETLIFLENHGVAFSAVGFGDGHRVPGESSAHWRGVEWGRSYSLCEMVILDVAETHEVVACMVGVDKPDQNASVSALLRRFFGRMRCHLLSGLVHESPFSLLTTAHDVARQTLLVEHRGLRRSRTIWQRAIQNRL